MTTLDTRPTDIDTDDGGPVLVDQAPEPRLTTYDKVTARRKAKIRPIVPDWVRSPRTAKSLTVFFGWYYLHILGYHLVRIPTSYQVKLLPRVPVGAYRLLRDLVNGLTDAEARPLRKSAVVRDDAAEYLRLKKERNAVVRHRVTAAIVLSIPVLAIGVGLAWLAPWWLQILAAILVADLLGYYGRDYSTPVFTKATVPAFEAPPLRADVVETAIRALPGYGAKGVLEFTEPIYRDGEGWMAKVRLTHGYTVTKVLNNKEELASGLRRPLGAVWPEGEEDDASILKLWVGFKAFAKMTMPSYPLTKGAADFFKPIPYGRTQRMSPIGIRPFENNIILGAIPGAGKSAAIRVLCCGLALDPTVRLRLWSLKQNDLAELEPVSHTFGYGLTDDVIEACLEDLRAVKAEVIRRTQVLSKVQAQNRALCPDGKLTRELANRRDLGLQPEVLVIDECQNLFLHERYGAEAGKLTMEIARMGRAYGVVLILATQRPDANSLPKGISTLFSVRICLRMTDHVGVDMVLGTGAHSRGLKAELFKASEQGMGFLLGVTNEDLVGRSYYVDGPAAERIVARAHALREADHRLSGHALTVDADRQEEKAAGADFLADLERVMVDQGISWMWNVAACGALDALNPGAYAGLTAETIGVMLSKRNVPTRQLNRVDPQDPPGSKR